MQPAQILSITQACSIVGSVPHTIAGWLWAGITMLGPFYSATIIVGLVLWVIFEIATRNAKWKRYSSDNGFSPLFNVVVGSVVYFALQELLGLALSSIFGDAYYCVPWPYALHAIVYIATGLILRFTGFWTYLRILGEKPRKRSRSKY